MFAHTSKHFHTFFLHSPRYIDIGQRHTVYGHTTRPQKAQTGLFHPLHAQQNTCPQPPCVKTPMQKTGCFLTGGKPAAHFREKRSITPVFTQHTRFQRVAVLHTGTLPRSTGPLHGYGRVICRVLGRRSMGMGSPFAGYGAAIPWVWQGRLPHFGRKDAEKGGAKSRKAFHAALFHA